MKGRNLVVMFDGTWNVRDSWTNVSRMFEAVDRVAEERADEFQPPGEEARDGEPVQLVKYIPGVGTGVTGKLSGGMFGYGLSEKMKEGYRWLSKNYRPHDQIFVFGFSRGAFTARALVSFVHKCGGLLLDPHDEAGTEKLIEEAYALYSEVVEKEEYLREHLEHVKQFSRWNCRKVRVKMIGVWDTVGALAVPHSFLKIQPTWWNGLFRDCLTLARWMIPASMTREHYRFHNLSLPCIVDEAYHALAIDEHREDFVPHLWDSRKKLDPADQNDHLIVPPEQKVEQCWFAGSHCNVGGGIDNDQDPEDLWQLSYEWMQDKAEKAGLRFKWSYKSNGTRWRSLRRLENSYENFGMGFYHRFNDPIDRAIIREKRPDMTMEGSKAETLHWSVKLRMENDPLYRPPALLCHDGDFGSAYDTASKDYLDEALFVDSDGEKYHSVIPFDPMEQKVCSCKYKGIPKFTPPYDGYKRDNFIYHSPLVLQERRPWDYGGSKKVEKNYGLDPNFLLK